MPNNNPPINAPGIDPIPPNTAAVNALIPGIDPSVGATFGYALHSSNDAIAAKPEPIAKVIDIVVLTLIPINLAASLSSEQALIAEPVFV